jgi:hypothetical protein
MRKPSGGRAQRNSCKAGGVAEKEVVPEAGIEPATKGL